MRQQATTPATQAAAFGGMRRLRSAWHTTRTHPSMLIGLLILLFMGATAIFAPVIARSDPTKVGNVYERLRPPSAQHWFGQDNLGADVFDRTIYGGRISLFVGFAVGILGTGVGVIIGLIAGYWRMMDNIIMRFVDGLLAFPGLLLALMLIALLGGSIVNIIIVLSVGAAAGKVRVVRATVLSLREQMYVEAARAVGVPASRILFRHVLPNTFAPVIVMATLAVAGAMLGEASLSFLGLGLPTYEPSWGNIMGLGRSYLQAAVWVTFFPGLFLTATVLAVNMVGDSLRDVLDPRMRGAES